jgi:mannose-6-phosphate isomerase-like protein (cupin superfamily)
MKKLGGYALSIACVALAAMGTMTAMAQEAQTPAQDAVLSSSRVFPLEQMAVRKMANGGESRSIVHGVLKTGEGVALHESTLPAGLSPNAGHAIQHSEFIVVNEGTLEFDHDGRTETVGPGGVIYVAYGTFHKVKNVGKVPARYVVVAIGGDTKK